MKMPDKLLLRFLAADEALFNLHREMELSMSEMPGKDNWREVYGLRLRLNSEIKPMAINNFLELPR